MDQQLEPESEKRRLAHTEERNKKRERFEGFLTFLGIGVEEAAYVGAAKRIFQYAKDRLSKEYQEENRALRNELEERNYRIVSLQSRCETLRETVLRKEEEVIQLRLYIEKEGLGR